MFGRTFGVVESTPSPAQSSPSRSLITAPTQIETSVSASSVSMASSGNTTAAVANSTVQANTEDLKFLASSTLLRRSEPLEPEASSAPRVPEEGADSAAGNNRRPRHYELRRNADDTSVIAAATRVLDDHPDDGKAAAIRAQAYFRLGRYDESAADFAVAVRASPEDASLWFGKAQAHERLEQFSEAMASYNSALAIEPDNVRAVYARGACMNLMGDLDGAVAAYADAIALDAKGFQQGLNGKRNRGTRNNIAVQPPSSSPTDASTVVPPSPALDSRAAGGTPALRAGARDAWDVYGGGQTAKMSYQPSRIERAPAPASALNLDAIVGPRAGSAAADAAPRNRGENDENHPNIANGKSSSSAYQSGDEDVASLAEVHHAKGFAHRKAGRFEEAIEEYTQALSYDQRHFRALFNRAFSYDRIGNLENAIEDYSTALSIEPRASFALYNRGIARDKVNDHAGAIDDFTRAIAEDPNNADFYHNRGFAKRKLGDFPGAVLDYTAAIRLNANHHRAYYNRAYAYERLGLLHESADDYTTALQLDPENAAAYHNRGSLRERLGDRSGAVQDFSKALAHAAPGACVATTLAARAAARHILGDVAGAADDIDAAIALEPEAASHRRWRAARRRDAGELELAAEDLAVAVANDPSNGVAWSSRGYCLRKLGRFAEAHEAYTYALRHVDIAKGEDLRISTARLYSNRAYCAARLGQFADAAADYTKVLELTPDDAHAAHNRQVTLERLSGKSP